VPTDAVGRWRERTPPHIQRAITDVWHNRGTPAQIDAVNDWVAVTIHNASTETLSMFVGDILWRSDKWRAALEPFTETYPRRDAPRVYDRHVGPADL
jgi:hypothetical protein